MRLERWAWYSIAVNVVLAALHAWIAAASGSLAVTAELVHNLVDLLTAVAVLIGLKLAMRKTKAFPYGLYKVENLVAAGLAGMIFFAAYEIARDALLGPGAPVQVDAWMLAVVALTTAVPLVFSHFELRVARSAHSPALTADAREYRVHVLTTGLVFAALLSEGLRFPIDRIAALVIVVAVVKTGWDLLRDAMRVLLDASLDARALERIRQLIDADPAVTEIRWVTGRNAGRFCFVEAGITLRVAELEKAEAAIRRIETNVRAALPRIERALLHVEPPTSARTRYAVPLADAGGAVSRHFGQAPYFALITVHGDDGAVAERHVVTNPHRAVEKAKGIRVAEWLLSQKVDVVLLREDLQGKGPAYVFAEAGVDLRKTDEPTLTEVMATLSPRSSTPTEKH